MARERSEEEEMFATLTGAIDKPPKQEWRQNLWIRPGIWADVDEPRPNANSGVLTRQEGRKLTWKIRWVLREDRVE